MRRPTPPPIVWHCTACGLYLVTNASDLRRLVRVAPRCERCAAVTAKVQA